ncbi:hypothetical protein LPJ66_011547 [Kickxella alabastrina]|uniref:Uncharacterized protein n=1 Tax=Kickxella alabastrina TaxID=61397 RepID=A0ACC1HZV2_9FUNG|nr:hypothetical protein LPJ66_011547 [Kickxella alabastrina]
MLFFSKSNPAGYVIVAALASHAAGSKWSLTQMTAEERGRTCHEQVSFCYNSCGSVANTSVNFCNMRTMGWNCACVGGSGEKRVPHFEWPIEVAECGAALKFCNKGCIERPNDNNRGACFTTCATDYPCNTIEAPFSSLRVQNINDKPAGYMPPIDEKDVELTIGMKFGANTPGMDEADKRLQKATDPGTLPKIAPRVDDNAGAAKGGKGNKDNSHVKGTGASGSGKDGDYKKGAHPESGNDGVLVSAGAVNALSFAHTLAVAAALVLMQVSI